MNIDVLSLLMGKALGSGGGGGGDEPRLRERWDFTGTDPLVGKIQGWNGENKNVTFGATGAVFDSATDSIILMSLRRSCIWEVDVASSEMTNNANKRFIMASISNGFIFRGGKAWAFYDGSTWQETEEADPNYFSGHTVRVEIDNDAKWHIYRDGTLFFEPTSPLNIGVYRPGTSDGLGFSALRIGSDNGTSIDSAVITAARLYY